jgi:uncharacterized protein (TIGR03083 family)
MAADEMWSVIHAERGALAADLEGLSDEQWAMLSLSVPWTVRDVLAHMTSAAKLTPGKFFGTLIGSGFRFEKVQQKGVAENRGATPGECLAGFKAVINSSSHPPGPSETWLGEVLVHSQDIRRPLGITHDYPTDSMVRAADFYKGSNVLIGSKKRIAGVHLEATDADWSSGDGPVASGPIASIVLAMTGRKAALGDLTGDGVATLQSRD